MIVYLVGGRPQGDRTLLLSAQPHTLLVHDSCDIVATRTPPLSGIVGAEVNLAPGEVWKAVRS